MAFGAGHLPCQSCRAFLATSIPHLYSNPPDMNEQLDVLAIAAHRDDVEQTCGGTLLKMAEQGRRTGILDLTRGEMGTRGTAAEREAEANEAARILKVSWRRALDIPDARVENTWENRLKVARVLRETRPRVVILPYWKGRHPDHYTAATLGSRASDSRNAASNASTSDTRPRNRSVTCHCSRRFQRRSPCAARTGATLASIASSTSPGGTTATKPHGSYATSARSANCAT